MISRILVIAWKEFLQVRRDRLTLAMMVALPIMQLMLFGFAINTDVRNIPTVVIDYDWTRSSRELVAEMEATRFYTIRGYLKNDGQIETLMRRGEAKVALVIPKGHSEKLSRGGKSSLGLVVDGSDPQTVASAMNTVIGLAEADSARLAARLSAQGAARVAAPRIQIEPRIWYNPDQRTATFIVPGLAGVILTLTMVMFTSMAIARERERGTLEQLIVSPMKRSELIIGKILPYILVGYVQLSLILIVGRLVFEVRPLGQVPLLMLLAALFIAANLAIGLVFSTLARTQQQAMQMSFFFLLPNILLSGFMFPWEAMPVPIQGLSQILPLTHFLRIIRGIVLKGSELSDLVREVYWLLGSLLLFASLAALRFQKKLDQGEPMARPQSGIRERILEAAQAHFLKEGVDGSSLRAIARQAETNIGMIYYYFPHKDDLFLAVMETTYVGVLERLVAAIDPGQSFEARVLALFRLIADLTESELTVARLLVREALGSKARLERLFERFQTGHLPHLLGLVLSGMQGGQIDPKIHPLLAMAALGGLGIFPQLVASHVKKHLPVVSPPEGEALTAELTRLYLRAVGLQDGAPHSPSGPPD